MNTLRFVLSIGTVGFLAWIILRTDLGALVQSISRISLSGAVACLVLVQVQIVLSALRWRFTARRLGQTISPTTAIGEYYVASLLNQTLPGGMGGDAVRAWRMRKTDPGGWKRPAKAVIFERLSGQIAFLTLALVGLGILPFLAGTSIPANPTFLLAAVTVIVLAGLAWLVWHKRRDDKKGTLRDDLLDVFMRRRAWLFQALTSTSIVFSYVAVFFIAARETGSDLPFLACLTIIPFCLVAMLIPTGFGGWGTREAAAMALWPMLGATSTQGLAASITYGWLSLAGAAPGIIVLLATSFGKRLRQT